MIKRFFVVVVPCLLAAFALTVLAASAQVRVPNDVVCIGAGPLPLSDPEYCGCMHGEVQFRGKALDNIPVMLSYGDSIVTGATTIADSSDINPTFRLSGRALGARRGDMMTLFLEWEGVTISQTVRSWPDADGNQHVVLTIPDSGQWEPTADDSSGYVKSLALADNVLWSGGTDGVLQTNLERGTTTHHAVGSVTDVLTVGDDVWTLGADGVQQYDGESWQTHILPVAGSLYAIAHDPTSDNIWVSTYDAGNGYLTVYDGSSWQTAAMIADYVTHLVVDQVGKVWAGTWQSGIFRQGVGYSFSALTTVDGLASNQISALATSADAVYIGTRPYLDVVSDTTYGGISRYSLSNGSWETFTVEDGLPGELNAPELTIYIRALAIAPDGTVYAGTADGVHLMGASGIWASYGFADGLPRGNVNGLTAGSTVWAGSTQLAQFLPDAAVGSPPIATINSAVVENNTLHLEGGGGDIDETEQALTAYAWWVTETGEMLCNTISCTLPTTALNLPPGTFTVAFHVQDDEGDWSSPMTQIVTNGPTSAIKLRDLSTPSYTPLVMMMAVLLSLITLVYARRLTR